MHQGAACGPETAEVMPRRSGHRARSQHAVEPGRSVGVPGLEQQLQTQGLRGYRHLEHPEHAEDGGRQLQRHRERNRPWQDPADIGYGHAEDRDLPAVPDLPELWTTVTRFEVPATPVAAPAATGSGSNAADSPMQRRGGGIAPTALLLPLTAASIRY